ncbi:MAG: helix-turn-helix transcriptional regulator [Bacteroidales bacterium]|nr:helix-turn-helix transcriptional regulator [Bacteroidales bacterium]
MNVPFKIIKLTKEFIEPVLLNPIPSHRHDHEELLIITHGKPVHFLDYTKETLQPPVIVYVAQGKVHNFVPDAETSGWVIRFKNELVPNSRFNFYSNFLDRVNYKLNDDYCSTTLNSLCEIMLKEFQEETINYQVITHLLSALLTKLEADSKTEYLDNQAANRWQMVTFNSFLKILEFNYMRPEGADFYSEKLNMSTRNLNLISQSAFGKSVTDIIETRKLIEARNLLLNSAKSVSEIGYDLGYNEKSHFTKVFRKRTGVTPTEYRDQMHTDIS